MKILQNSSFINQNITSKDINVVFLGRRSKPSPEEAPPTDAADRQLLRRIIADYVVVLANSIIAIKEIAFQIAFQIQTHFLKAVAASKVISDQNISKRKIPETDTDERLAVNPCKMCASRLSKL